jgi:hypothetical protein
MDQSLYRPQHGLLGLALQTYNNGLPGNEVHASKEVIEATPHDQEQIPSRLCPIHKSLLAGIPLNMDAQPGQVTESKHTPMERYLAEGLVERYALFSIGMTNAGEEWARYSGCLCGPK